MSQMALPPSQTCKEGAKPGASGTHRGMGRDKLERGTGPRSQRAQLPGPEVRLNLTGRCASRAPDLYGDASEATRGVRARGGTKLSTLPATPEQLLFHLFDIWGRPWAIIYEKMFHSLKSKQNSKSWLPTLRFRGRFGEHSGVCQDWGIHRIYICAAPVPAGGPQHLFGFLREQMWAKRGRRSGVPPHLPRIPQPRFPRPPPSHQAGLPVAVGK